LKKEDKKNLELSQKKRAQEKSTVEAEKGDKKKLELRYVEKGIRKIESWGRRKGIKKSRT